MVGPVGGCVILLLKLCIVSYWVSAADNGNARRSTILETCWDDEVFGSVANSDVRTLADEIYANMLERDGYDKYNMAFYFQKNQ